MYYSYFKDTSLSNDVYSIHERKIGIGMVIPSALGKALGVLTDW